MSTPTSPLPAATAGARETARQDNGQFGTQPLAEVEVDLAVTRTGIATDTWTGQQHVVSPDPIDAMNERLERARDHWYDHSAVTDLLETVENQDEDDEDSFDPDLAAYAVLFDERDDDDDRCSNVAFYNAAGDELGEIMQAGYTINSVPQKFLADNAPGTAGHLGAVDLAKVRAFDRERFAREYVDELTAAGEEMVRDSTNAKYAAWEARESATKTDETTCPKCGSPTDAPDPTCSMCPESERVACYAGQCTYIATDDADLDSHVSEDCQYQDNSEGRLR